MVDQGGAGSSFPAVFRGISRYFSCVFRVCFCDFRRLLDRILARTGSSFRRCHIALISLTFLSHSPRICFVQFISFLSLIVSLVSLTFCRCARWMKCVRSSRTAATRQAPTARRPSMPSKPAPPPTSTTVRTPPPPVPQEISTLTHAHPWHSSPTSPQSPPSVRAAHPVLAGSAGLRRQARDGAHDPVQLLPRGLLQVALRGIYMPSNPSGLTPDCLGSIS